MMNVMLTRGAGLFVLCVWVLSLFSGCQCGANGLPCSEDADCAKGEICADSVCTVGCRSSQDCNAGQICAQSKCTSNVCIVGTERACAIIGETGKNLGLCSDGREACINGGTAWGKCSALAPQREVCDRLDNDCDGKIDESDTDSPISCECSTPGSMRLCYYGPPNTHVVGTCAAGVQYCTADYAWGKCHDAVTPKAEICDKQDNDCNGKTDDGITCTCEPGSQRSCYTGPISSMGKGVCKAGKQTCGTDRTWGACEGMILPTPEENHGCNGKDDDCDGTIDERADGFGLLRACVACENGDKQDCYDGPIGAFVGACKHGSQTCVNGAWGRCEGQVLPAPEICDDNVDNDCDGNIDEGCTVKPCKENDERECFEGPAGRAGNAPCKVGKQICKGGKWGACQGQVVPEPEKCGDLKDNDCDGRVDEECTVVTCSPNGKEEACYTGPDQYQGVGSCVLGKRICRFGRWSTCEGQVLPQKDRCDGKDDDCDGQPDTGCDCRSGTTRQCFPKDQEGCQSLGKDTYSCTAPCKAGTQSCVDGKWEADCRGAVVGKNETCNDQDDDCDGSIDENLQRPCYTGPAGTDGKGICKAGNETCTNGTWGTCVGESGPKLEVCDGIDNDCDGQTDEADPKLDQPCVIEANKGTCREGKWKCISDKIRCQQASAPTQEQCNGKDDDCDGQTDEDANCVCQNNQTQACYSGLTGTAGMGLCQAGTQTCSSNKWGACVGEILPKAEICDNQDNDCNGKVDDLLTRPCFSGQSGCTKRSDGSFNCIGGCRAGTQTCSAGAWSVCAGEVVPTTEICDNIDNNCDGQIDEGVQRTCYEGVPKTTNGVGPCKSGTQKCINGGKWDTCQGQILPQPELCDNVDNNCDGQIDDGLVRDCYTGPGQTHQNGICKKGKETCSGGAWGTCVGEVKPGVEICNNKDDDCDGSVDEALEQPCYSGPTGTVNVGICKAGKQSCQAGQWSSCGGEVLPATEICDSKDNDCNGQIDDANCVCSDGQTQPCGSNIGECQQGMQLCTGGNWGSCGGGVGPTPEKCDNLDNDCDGSIDEDFPNLNQSCGGGQGPCYYSGTYICKSDFSGVECSSKPTYTPQTEKCDNIDNDCDGQVDEDWPTLNQSCGGGQGPCYYSGTMICKSDFSGIECSSKPTYTPQTEKCDNIDNDCDGLVDEDWPNLNQSCGGGLGECYFSGTYVCKSDLSGVECSSKGKAPTTEICDGLDNDCDGQTDEGGVCSDGGPTPDGGPGSDGGSTPDFPAPPDDTLSDQLQSLE